MLPVRDCIHACEFSRRFSKLLGRDLAAVHVLFANLLVDVLKHLWLQMNSAARPPGSMPSMTHRRTPWTEVP